MRTFNATPICQGDRIYVRAMQDGATLMEMTINNVSDYTQLVGEIRYAGKNLSGLCKLFIRNHSQGWSRERYMKFYSGEPTPYRRELRALMHEAVKSLNRPQSVSVPASKRHIPFPWETH